MRLSKKLLKRPVAILFLDHSIGAGTIKTAAIGILNKIERDTVELTYWTLTSEDEDLKHNEEHLTIVRSTILAVLELRVKRCLQGGRRADLKELEQLFDPF